MLSLDKAPRVSTGVAGLDEMLGGGLVQGDSTLLAGSPGTGKTTLALQFIAAGVMAGENGVFVTFEYLPQQLYRDAAAKGWPLRKWEDEGRVRVVCTTPEILVAQGESGATILDEAMAAIGASRLVIDSLSHFEFLGWPPQVLRSNIAGLLNHFKLTQVTTIVSHEVPQIVGPAVTISAYGLEFLVDNVIVLRYVELESELRKAVSVMKFRGGDHDRRFRSLKLTSRGAVVEPGFAGVENIIGGYGRRTAVERARELV
ncbi:MAG: AAA family ATPase [Euryarchaeota archaeon]|nr:AAA family ATPase [Euryarchaeota archaeon]